MPNRKPTIPTCNMTQSNLSKHKLPAIADTTPHRSPSPSPSTSPTAKDHPPPRTKPSPCRSAKKTTSCILAPHLDQLKGEPAPHQWNTPNHPQHADTSWLGGPCCLATKTTSRTWINPKGNLLRITGIHRPRPRSPPTSPTLKPGSIVEVIFNGFDPVRAPHFAWIYRKTRGARSAPAAHAPTTPLHVVTESNWPNCRRTDSALIPTTGDLHSHTWWSTGSTSTYLVIRSSQSLK
ncbi:hypothetical protein BDK51DRAFT_51677 [Blyttiomyces helicus]|uniref:Uncharacterized protein n=1 Tax=Blyttiomyces helicus TaxID=388810 RepID=A0A4P9WHC6_9FUNG|nr:hypothetical protein BDK51DRAFT_51677 [Blyttiomyces helicus]|eukprot:RKO90480.1 hypothetical protein BDK51DRAFT_51677 [Blyttiomyces helicus]